MEKVEGSVVIIGAGISGLSTARYLLSLTQNTNNVNVIIIDRCSDTTLSKSQLTYPSYETQNSGIKHYSIPSRRNGNVLCPSSTIPWTAQPLWNAALLPMLKACLMPNEGLKRPSIVSFDWYSLVTDPIMKFILGRPEHQSNKSILEYSMKCFDDTSDEIVRSIEYGRLAKGTKKLDGTIARMDSSGDIGLFCQGLQTQLVQRYGDRLKIIPGEEVLNIDIDGNLVRGVTSVDQDGNTVTRGADAVVVACGIESTHLCRNVGVPCPLYPVKGHLLTAKSNIDSEYNLVLPGAIGYASPIAHLDPEKRRYYRLSGFVDFTANKEVDGERVNALLAAARVFLPDLELIDSSVCHRPTSADDRPLVGRSGKYSNLYLCCGLGSRGWTMGLGSGKLLACHMLKLPCPIDPAPYLPSRFVLGTY